MKRKEKVTVTCVECGTQRLVNPCRAGAKFCGMDCRNKAMIVDVIDGKKECSRCHLVKLIEEFVFRGKKSDNKRSSWCRECHYSQSSKTNKATRGVIGLKVDARYKRAVNTAKYRKIEWTLPEDFYIELVVKPCIYCDASTGKIGVGLDRMNSYKGYHIDNVVPCCGGCNIMRGKDYIPFDIMLNEISPILKKIKGGL